MSIQLQSSDNSITIAQLTTCSWDLTVPFDTENNLLYGGVVTWLQDYDFYVSPAGYYIHDVFYESPEAYITLSPADDDLDRFDVIYVDADGIVKVLEGTPSLTPSQPGLDLGSQVGLGVIFVEHGTTQPVGAIEECAYVDNAEWSTLASDGSIDVASANTPCSGSFSIEGTTVTAGDYFKLVNGSAILLADYNVIHFLIRSKGAWGNRQLNIQFYIGGLAVGTAVVLKHNVYNFASNNVVDCQLVTINLSDFNVPLATTIDEIRFTMSGGNNIGFFIDNICIQNNGSVVFPADNDIHNQYFGPQTPGDWWIAGNNRTHGWITSPDILTGGDGSEKFGWGSRVTGSTGTAIGWGAQAHGQEGATALGNQSVANVGVAIGFGAVSTRGVAIGGYQTGSGGTVVGWGANSNALSAIAIGGNAQANGNSAVSLGYYAFGNGYGSIAIGSGAQAMYNYSAAIGVFAEAKADSQFVIGGDHLYTDTGFTSLYFGSGVTSPWNANRFWSVTGAEGTNIAGTSWTLAGAPGTGNANSGPIYFQTADPTTSGSTLQSWTTKVGLNSNTLGLYLDNTRFQMDEGADVVATGDLPLGTGNAFTITGNTTINAITNTNWQDGAVIYLTFTGTPTLKHDTTGGAGTTRLRLAGAVDFVVTANTELALILKDGYWREVGRTQATVGGGGDVTADNGLTISGLQNVQLGSASVGGAPLLHDTYIGDASPYSILVTSTVTGTNSTLISTNTSTGAGLFGVAVSGVGSGGSATIGTGGAFRATSGIGLTAHSDSSYAFIADTTPTSTNTVVPIMSLQRGVSGGSGANGVGISIEMAAETSTGVTWTGNTLVSKWTNATEGSRVSEFSVTGVNNTITSTLFRVKGSGQLQGDKYGVGTFVASPAYSLGVDASGNIVEFVGGGGGGSLSANNGLTENVSDNVQLGGTLIQTTTVNTGGFQTNWTGTNSGVAILNLFNDGTGPGIVSATTGGGTSGYFTAQGGTAVVGEQGLTGGNFSGSVIGVAAGGTSDSAIPLSVTHTLTTTNTASRMISIVRASTGTPTAGIGSFIEYDIESDGGTAHAGRIGYVLTDVTDTFEDSRFDLTVMSGGAMSRAMAIHDTGQMTLDKYGVGSFPDTPAYALGVDASGNVIEFTPGVGGAGFITANNGLNASSATNVQLGGPLVQNTAIATGNFQYSVTMTGSNGFIIDGNGGTDPFLATHLENAGVTRYTDFQLYNDGLVFNQIYDAKTMGISSNSGGITIEADDGSEYAYIDIGAGGYTFLESSLATYITGKTFMDSSGFQEALGSPSTAANDLNVIADGNLFFVNGSTQINAILVGDWQAGAKITLLFLAAPLVKHATTGGAGTAPIWLQGSVDFQAAANDRIQLVYDGGEWIELSRTLAAGGGGGSLSANNGLTENVTDNVQLGGTLVQTTTIDATSSYHLIMTGSAGSNVLEVSNTGSSGVGINVTAVNGNGVVSQSTNGSGITGYSGTNIGVLGFSLLGGNYGVAANGTAATTNTVQKLLLIQRQTTGTAANGIGTGIDFGVQTSAGSLDFSNQFISKWTDATTASRTSQFIITGTSNTTLADLFTLSGTGALKLNKYGIDSFTGTAAKWLAVDSSGNIIEESAPSGGFTTASNGLTASTATNVVLGGTLTGTTNIAVNGQDFSFQGSGSNITYFNDGAIDITVNNGTIPLLVTSNASASFSPVFINNKASTNDIKQALELRRSTTGTAAAGIGVSLALSVENDGGTPISTGAINAVLTTVTAAAETSKMEFSTQLAGTSNIALTLTGDGALMLRSLTATQASAITPAAGMIVFVNNTNGTFTSVGFWGYDGSAWAKF